MGPREFLEGVCKELKIEDDAIVFCINKYEKALERSFDEVYSPSVILIGALYLYCRENNIPRMLGEISEVSLTKKEFVGKAYMDIKKWTG